MINSHVIKHTDAKKSLKNKTTINYKRQISDRKGQNMKRNIHIRNKTKEIITKTKLIIITYMFIFFREALL